MPYGPNGVTVDESIEVVSRTDEVLQAASEAVDWRLLTFALYERVRVQAAYDPATAHATWRALRDDMLATHPASPLPLTSRAAFAGMRMRPYDPSWRFVVRVQSASRLCHTRIETEAGVMPYELIGKAEIPRIGTLDVWRLTGGHGGLYIPVKDQLAGRPGGTYAGGRHLVDSIEGAWLGEIQSDQIVLDFNFAYNPVGAYTLGHREAVAPDGNTVAVPVPVGELMEA